MKNRKVAIIFIIIVIIVAILAGAYKIMTSYMFKKENNTIEDGETEIIEYLKSIEDIKEREEKVKFFIESNDITEDEAKEILGK